MKMWIFLGIVFMFDLAICKAIWEENDDDGPGNL